ncbi:MAG: type II toxin-antitoxin system Phd/YefM family antitoxin [Bacteroidetes bacterium]|nr:type II toxin-antitoxin system Phd/YefM family antitoxin [Bacteroidota bacterium]
MKSLSATQARKDIYRIIDETCETNEPVLITTKRSDAVLVGKSDWDAMQETLYLNSIPGMTESIQEGLNTPLDATEEDLDW